MSGQLGFATACQRAKDYFTHFPRYRQPLLGAEPTASMPNCELKVRGNEMAKSVMGEKRIGQCAEQGGRHNKIECDVRLSDRYCNQDADLV